MMKRPLSLSDSQLRLIRHAAASLPVDARDNFLKTVAAHLTGEPSDHAVQAATTAALGRVPVFMCDAKTKETTQ
jgi:hypothetical protein